MELGRRFNPKVVFVGLYVVAFLVFVIYGMQPAEAVEAYDVSARLAVPSIGLDADVTTLTLENGELPTPDTIVGSYTKAKNKMFLVGHSTTVFENLKDVRLGDAIFYDEKEYTVSKMTMIKKEAINMNKLLAAEEKDTLVLMTCAGKRLGNGDATFRLIIEATK